MRLEVVHISKNRRPALAGGFSIVASHYTIANMKNLWLAVLLFAAVSFAQSYQSGTVLKWEMKPYSQSAHIIRDHVVYSIRIGTAQYEVARRSKNVEMTAGQKVECRLEKSAIYLRNTKGKEIKYEIVGNEPAQ